MKPFLLAAALLLGAAVPAHAQCPTAIAFTSYGKTCDYFGQLAVLAGGYDATTCTLTLKQSYSTTCCNTYPWQQFLLLGLRQIVPGIPHPALLDPCELSVVPVVVLAQTRGALGVWSLHLPPLPGAVTVYAQGINDYFTTINFTHDLQSTNGLRMDIS